MTALSQINGGVAIATVADGDKFIATDVSDTTESVNGTTKPVLASVLKTYIGAQPVDATLTALAGLTIAANSLSVGAGADAFTQTAFAANTFPARSSTGNLVAKAITDFGLSLVDDADAATARATMGLVIGTHVQAQNASLTQLAGLADPNADRLLFWDDSAGSYAHLTLGTNLSITGTTIDAAGGGGSVATDAIFDAAGDLVQGTGDNTAARLPIGTALQVLRVNAGATAFEWAAASGGGDVSKVGTPVNNQLGVWTGNGTIEGDAALTFDTATDTLSIGASGILAFGAVNILSDSAGTTTLNNIDALDATTEATIEAAIDTLANLTSVQGHTVTLTGAFVRSGAHSLTFTTTATTALTLPTTGTLATLAGSESLSSKTLVAPSLSGIVTSDGASITTANAMGALAVDVTKGLNTKSVSADSTFTFSATPGTNTWFGMHVTNTDTAPHILTFPSAFSQVTQAARTTCPIAASGQLYLIFRYDGSAYKVFGDGAFLNKFDATTAPGVGDDIADGYGPGSLWGDATAPAFYWCESNGAGAAVWNAIGGGSGSVATDTIWNAAGDLVQGTGSDTAARLALGTALQVLQVNAGATAAQWGAVTGTGSVVRATSPTLVTPALGTPASGVVTNLTGTANININGTVGATTPAAGTFTTLVAGSTTSLLLGTAGSAVGNIGFRNATSGTATLAPPTGALGTYSVTLPNAASTLPIFGQQITFAGPTAARTVTLPDSAFTVVGLATAQTLTSKIIQIAALPGTDDTYEGAAITGRNAGATIAQWEAVYLDASGTWQLADANGSGTFPCRGLAVAAYANTNPAVVLDDGVARNDAWAWTIGGDVYLSATAGGLTQTAPATSGDKVQKIGYALSADSIRVNIGSGEYLTVT